MFKQFEIILTAFCLLLSVVFLTLTIIRIRKIYINKQSRIPIWDKKVGVLNRISKIVLAVSLLFLVPGVIYFLFIVTLPCTVI